MPILIHKVMKILKNRKIVKLITDFWDNLEKFSYGQKIIINILIFDIKKVTIIT